VELLIITGQGQSGTPHIFASSTAYFAHVFNVSNYVLF